MPKSDIGTCGGVDWVPAQGRDGKNQALIALCRAERLDLPPGLIDGVADEGAVYAEGDQAETLADGFLHLVGVHAEDPGNLAGSDRPFRDLADFADRIKDLGVGVPNPTPSPELPEELYFPITEPMITGPATRIMSLRDGTKKMSKSDASDMSRINLTDDADTISKKIRKAKTDPEPLPDTVKGLESRPEARNLVNIYAALAETTTQAVIDEYGGAQFGSFKPALADLAVAKLEGITAKMSELMNDPAEIDRVLGDGANRANEIAEPILRETYDIVGFVRSR